MCSCYEIQYFSFFLVLKVASLVDKGIFFKYKKLTFQTSITLNTKSPGPYPSQLSPETPGLGFTVTGEGGLCQPHRGAPSVKGIKVHSGYQEPPPTLSLEMLRAQYLMQRIETKILQPDWETWLLFYFSIIQNTLF